MYQEAELVTEIGNLKKFALRLAGNMSDAEDLVQMTVLRAIEKKNLFQKDTSLFKWSAKIMFNLFVNEYRKKKKYEAPFDLEHYSMSVEPPQEAAADLLRVQQAMKQLPPAHRQVLIMVCIQNMPYQAVADKLNLPVGTVRSRLFRAREGLQHLLAPANSNRNLPVSAFSAAM
jgi:RNA polymerase sigma-70 factor, ECF subfamily